MTVFFKPHPRKEPFDPSKPGLYDVPVDGEVIRTDVAPMEISTEDGETFWFPYAWGDRSKARTWFQNETGAPFIEIRCVVEWLRCIDRYVDGMKDPGWADSMWFVCKPDDVGAVKFWRLET